MQSASVQQRVLRPEPRAWVCAAARLGYTVKGGVYAVMAALALEASLARGGRVASEHEAVEHIGRLPFGDLGLVVVGVGLLCYALWRVVEAVVDPYHEGNGFKGVALRAGAVASGLANGAIGIAALELVVGAHQGGEKTRPLVASLLREPWGAAALIAIGLGVLSAGVYQIYSAYADKFADHLSVSRLSGARRAWVFWSGRIGHAARGVIFGVMGVAFVQAALRADPNEAKGFKEAMLELGAQPFGSALLSLVAAGFLAYGLHLATTAHHRKLV